MRLPYYLRTCRSPVARSTNTSALIIDVRLRTQDSAASIADAVCSPIHGGSRTKAIELLGNQLGVLEEQEPDATAVALAYSNLTGIFGWLRMRRRISAHRKGGAD